jgi:hypothetical protein
MKLNRIPKELLMGNDPQGRLDAEFSASTKLVVRVSLLNIINLMPRVSVAVLMNIRSHNNPYET